MVKSGVSLRCDRSTLVHTSHLSRLKTPIASLATQKRLPRIHYTWYLSLRIRTSDSVQLEKRKEKKRIDRKERERNEKKAEKERKIKEKKRKEKKKKKRKKNVILADPKN